jgi:hypothetical protein
MHSPRVNDRAGTFLTAIAYLDNLDALMRKGHHLTMYVSDVSVLGPEKYEAPLG